MQHKLLNFDTFMISVQNQLKSNSWYLLKYNLKINTNRSKFSPLNDELTLLLSINWMAMGWFVVVGILSLSVVGIQVPQVNKAHIHVIFWVITFLWFRVVFNVKLVLNLWRQIIIYLTREYNWRMIATFGNYIFKWYHTQWT